jgi:hypothetical protein
MAAKTHPVEATPVDLSPAFAAKRVLEITFKWVSNYQLVSNKTLFLPQVKMVGRSIDWGESWPAFKRMYM